MIPTRTTDQAFSALFSVSRPFSEHLTKREDDQLRDKYDHNSFFYEGQPSVEEVFNASRSAITPLHMVLAESSESVVSIWLKP